MKGNCEEVKTTLYAGMSIFGLIKDVEISMKDKNISINDKKYLSLYLGVINTENRVSNYLKSNNIKIGTFINFKYLKQEEYLDIYNNYFVDILNEINFESIERNLEYLLSKDVIKDFNISNGYNINSVIEGNKQKVKVIN